MADADKDQLPRVEPAYEGEDAGALALGRHRVRRPPIPRRPARAGGQHRRSSAGDESSAHNKASAKEAWDSIAAARIGVDRVRRTTLQLLRKEWENLAFRPGEQVEDFALRLSALKQQMARHGNKDLDEEWAVEKLLHAAPKKYA